VLGRPAGAVGAVPSNEQAQVAIEQALEQGQTWRGEMIGRRKDGRNYDAAVVITPLRDAEGASVGFVSTHTDISSRKKLERARHQFITNVSHQLRTPATNIKIYAGLLGRPNLAARQDEYLDVLQRQSDQLSALVQDLLEITELDSGQAVRSWKPVSLPELIRESIVRFQEQAEEAGLALRGGALPPEFPPVTGDVVRLAQALAELVENGLRFTPAGGQVTLELAVRQQGEREWATLAVRDTGPGLSPAEQARAFERFFRGHLAESGHLSGTGLGLSIADEIVRAHGGRLTVESPAPDVPPDAPGPGSIFTMWLPL
jgi:signal transduction histidine kinase